MSKNIDKELNIINKAFTGIYTALDGIAQNINAVNTSRDEMKSNKVYTEAYIKDIIEKVINEKYAPNNALLLDSIETNITALYEATNTVMTAGDVLEDERISGAVSAVSVMRDNKDGIRGAEIIAGQFAGNFPVLNILSGVANNATITGVFLNKSLTADGLETMTDNLKAGLITMRSNNTAGDFVALSTRIYEYEKELNKDAGRYGITINRADYTALSDLLESNFYNAVRGAFGL